MMVMPFRDGANMWIKKLKTNQMTRLVIIRPRVRRQCSIACGVPAAMTAFPPPKGRFNAAGNRGSAASPISRGASEQCRRPPRPHPRLFASPRGLDGAKIARWSMSLKRHTAVKGRSGMRLWSNLPSVSDLAGRWRKPKLATLDQLVEFMAAQSAFVAQKCTIDYCQARSGLMWPKLEKEKAFREALDHARWEAYP